MSTPQPIALITGGCGDLARELRRQLTSAGWDVRAPGREEMDVTQTAQVSGYFAALPRLDLLVNQAAVVRNAAVTRLTEEAFDEVLDAGLSGAFRCVRAALKLMTRQRSGHLLQVGSFAARRGTVGQAAYAAAKAGLIGLTQSLAREYGARNIRANCVLPGFLDTRMTRAVLDDPVLREQVLGQHALGRLNSVEDAARFMVFLDSMRHVSGQVFQLDSRIARWT